MAIFNNIVLIDNDPISNFVSEKIISYLNFTKNVTTFLGGEDAIEYFKLNYLDNILNLPELILLHLDMPCMNGFEFIKAFNINFNYPQIILVILSTSTFEENIIKAKKEGIRYYICKPLSVEKLEKLFYCITKKEHHTNFELIQ